MGKPAPTLLPCGHFSTTTRDGEPACGICLDRAAGYGLRTPDGYQRGA